MSQSQLPIANYQAAPYSAPLSGWSNMADGIIAVPYEGCWLPSRFYKFASIEFAGSISSLSAEVWGTNQDSPVNSMTATIASTVAAGDVVTVNIANPNLPGGTQAASYTAVTSDTTTIVAAGITAAINANAALFAAGYRATSALGVITITWPTLYGQEAPGASSPPPKQNTTLITGAASPGVETVTVACGSDGVKLDTLTALGFQNLNSALPMRWLKLRIKTLTGSGANVSGYLQGVA